MVLIILGVTILLLGLIMTAVLEFIGPSSVVSFSEKIGVIPIEGAIDDSTPIVNQLIEYRKNKNIKAIIVRIESPGGGVGASQEIYREIMRHSTLTEKWKVKLSDTLGTIDYRLTQGSRAEIQLSTLLAHLSVVGEEME